MATRVLMGRAARRRRWTAALAAVLAMGGFAAGPAAVAAAGTSSAGNAAAHPADAGTYSVIGQPALNDATLATRCAGANARFSSHDFGGGFSTAGPTGIAIGPGGRLFVADDGGHRVLSWPHADSVSSCQAADQVIGAGDGVLVGPEAITVDGTGRLYVADTLNHTIDIFAPSGGSYPANPTYVLGTPGKSGKGLNQLDYPRGLAVDETGRLYVADDYNNRVLIFDPPFSSGMSADDSIAAGNDGGFSGDKALAVVGEQLFVADYSANRVLRFTGPFNDAASTYTATAEFDGIASPVDLTVGPDGTLYVSEQGDGAGVAPGVAVFPAAVTSGSQPAPVTTLTFGGALTGVPLGVAADASGRVFLADYEGYRVLVRDAAAANGPADAGADPSATGLLAALQARAGQATGRVLLGQEINDFSTAQSTWYRDFRRLHARGLRTPAIMAGELDALRNDRNDPVEIAMVAHADAGGVVELDWHPNDPVDNSYPGKPVSAAQLLQMASDPASPLYQTWHTTLDGAATTLAQFQTAGVPVLFRPLVEMNGVNFFWWSDDGSSGAAHAARIRAFAALWQDMVHYLTVVKGLHNLLFLYSPNALGCRCSVPAMTYYPGSAYVDAVGVDVYDNALSVGRSAGDNRGRTTYMDMVGTGKPFGFGEFGQGPNAAGTGTGSAGKRWSALTLVNRVKDSYPATAFATAWYSSFDSSGRMTYVYGLSDIANVAKLMANPLIATLPGSAP